MGEQEMKNVISIEIQLLTGQEIADRLRDKTKKPITIDSRSVYAYGEVYNSSSRMAYLTFDVYCNEYKYLSKEDMEIPLVAPQKLEPVFFVVYLGDLLAHNPDLKTLSVSYKIKRVSLK